MRSRILEIDFLRGLIILLMTLDHTRDFLGNTPYDATDLSKATTALFFSRWITHLCAPGFILLTGISLALKIRKTSAINTAQFAITRGFLFVIIEQTILRCFGWYFNFDYRFMNAGILWGIGSSLILIAPLLLIDTRYATLIGIGLIAALSIPGVTEYSQLWIWKCFVSGGDIEFLPDHHFYVSYPVGPWFAIMAIGFGIKEFLISDDGAIRKKISLTIGLTCIFAFLILRFNSLGNPTPRIEFPETIRSISSFINLAKYPPSICFTLLMLGLNLCMLGSAPWIPVRIRQFVSSPGQTPFLYYMLHVPLIHTVALILALAKYGRAEWLYNGPGIFWYEALPGHPDDYGYSLTIVYAVAILITIALSIALNGFKPWKDRSDSNSLARLL